MEADSCFACKKKESARHRLTASWNNMSMKDPPFLRTYLIYPSIWWYYLAIVADLVLRFMWVVVLMPGVGPHLSLFLGTIEIVRRSMWGLFRVEREHLVRLLNQTQNEPAYMRYR